MAEERNLSGAEISIVKAMLRRGWRNAVIHFYFNKPPSRLISSGRITQIKKGKYGASVEGPCRISSRRSCRRGRIWRQRRAGAFTGRHANSPLLRARAGLPTSPPEAPQMLGTM